MLRRGVVCGQVIAVKILKISLVSIWGECMSVIALIIVAVIYCSLPWYIELACWFVNLFFPDPIPYIDELLMFVPVVGKIKNIILVSEFLKKYGKIIIAVTIGILSIVMLVIFF